MLKIKPIDNRPKSVSKAYLNKLFKAEHSLEKKALNYSNNSLLKLLYLASSGGEMGDVTSLEPLSLEDMFLSSRNLKTLNQFLVAVEQARKKSIPSPFLLLSGSMDLQQEIFSVLSTSLSLSWRPASALDIEAVERPVPTPVDMLDEDLEALEKERARSVPYHLQREILVFKNTRQALEYTKHAPACKILVVSMEHENKNFNVHSFERPFLSMKLEPEDMWEEEVFNKGLKNLLSNLDYQSEDLPPKKLFASSRIDFSPSVLRGFMKRAKATSSLIGRPFDVSLIKSFIEEQSHCVSSQVNQSVNVIVPTKTLEDLVLGEEKATLEQLQGRLRHLGPLPEFMQRLRKNDERVIILFEGEPGTGKSASAEALANSLGKELWILDLARAQSAYVGETEKLLSSAFTMAESANAVLLIDEADGFLMGRSGEEPGFMRNRTNHLLNLFESFNGVLVLTTNHSLSIDGAFERRIDYKVHFQKPNKDGQIKILRKLLEPDAPVENLDYEALFKGIDLTGGFIRNAVEKAYYRMKEQKEQKLTQESLRWALEEVKKEGGLFKEKKKVIGISQEDV